MSRIIVTLSGIALLWAMTGCAGNQGVVHDMTYQVQKAAGPVTIDANWDKPAWQDVQPLELTHYMGEKPEHLPKVQAKLLYDSANVYVIFRVEDRYVRAVARNHQDTVCKDSCVEFFFAPEMDTAKGYFNLESNCGGTILLNFQTIPRKDIRRFELSDIEKIEIAHSQPKIVDPEVTEPTVWTVEYRLPVSILSKYRPEVTPPAPGVKWRANFFKCADQTSHPHWLTWAKVHRPQPDFHVPADFGVLEFK